MIKNILIKTRVLNPNPKNHNRPNQTVRLRRFVLDRKVDKTGVSGTGIITKNIEFNNKTYIINWLRHTRSTAIYANIKTLEDIHNHRESNEIKYIN